MPAKKKPVTERNKNGTERYSSRAAMQRHEKREPAKQARAEGDKRKR